MGIVFSYVVRNKTLNRYQQAYRADEANTPNIVLQERKKKKRIENGKQKKFKYSKYSKINLFSRLESRFNQWINNYLNPVV